MQWQSQPYDPDAWRDNGRQCVVDNCGHGQNWHGNLFDGGWREGACTKSGCTCKAFDHPSLAAERADRAAIGAISALYAQANRIGYPGVAVGGGFGKAPAGAVAGAQVFSEPAVVPAPPSVGMKTEVEQSTRASTVDHPRHYGGGDNPYEVIKVLDAWGFGVPFALGSAVKYIVRAGKKDPAALIEDLDKGRWYLDWVVNKLKAARDAGEGEE